MIWGADDLRATSTAVDGVVRSMTRDCYGRLTEMRVNGALLRTISYASDGSTTTTNVQTARTYDGMLQSVTDQDGHTTTIGRDNALRPTSLTDPLDKTSTVNYNNSGRVTVSTDRTRRATTTTYGPNDLTTRTSTTGYGPVTYIYNADRRMMSASGPTGVLTTGSLGPEASISKLCWSEYHQRATELALDILGADALVSAGCGPLKAFRADDPGAPNTTSSWLDTWYNAVAGRTYAGTFEVQRNILEEVVLGLPREPRRP